MTATDRFRVVVGVDFTGPSDAALQQALRMVQRDADVELHAVYVADPDELPDAPPKSSLEVIADVLERAPDHLRLKLIDTAAAMGVSPDGVETRVHVRIGAHAEAIHQVAVDYDADLIIVGSHNRKLLDRLVLGSVSEKLVREARCPVLVARPKDFTGLERTPSPDAPYAPGTPEAAAARVAPPRASMRVQWHSSPAEEPTGVRID